VGVSVSVDFGGPPQDDSRAIPQMITKPDKRDTIDVFIFLAVNLSKLLDFAVNRTQNYEIYFLNR
jgi:hypothetical protein